MPIRSRRKFIAPDGGWGYMIATAVALYFFIIFPIAQNFGLLYKDTFRELGFTGTQNTIILSTNLAFCNICGIINGPLIKSFGYRFVSFIGGVFIVVGLLLTAYATNFAHFFITYSIITSIGYGMGLQSFPVALNTYFVTKRSKVNGYVAAVYGLGPILMPQLISYLMMEYDVRSIMIIISAIAGNVLVAALLLQPVEWHMVKEKIDDVNNIDNGESENFLEKGNGTPKKLSMTFTDSTTSLHVVARVSVSEQTASICPEAGSESSDEYYDGPRRRKPLMKRILKTISKTFDLALLKDLTFVNIIFGLSLDFLSEINFLILMPFIMADFNLTNNEIATFMSTFAVADIIFRFLAPYFADILKFSQRVMLLISLTILMLVRSSLLFVDNFIPLLFCAAAIGMTRGTRLVYWTLVTPSHVPVDKLPAALGLQFSINGVMILLAGPLFGMIKDLTGSYRKCIYLVNFITFLAVLMWCVELGYKRYNKQPKTDLQSCDI